MKLPDPRTGTARAKENGSVLVIDDYPPARDAVKLALKDSFNCLSADSAKQGLEILKTNAIDVVILDIRMPEMDGIEALRRIREMGIKTKVIVLTGFGSLDSARKAIKYGAFDYLAKPFDLKELREVVGEAAQKNHLDGEGKDFELSSLTESLTARLARACRLARGSELSSEVLKEMKSPLTAILGYTQMILSKLKDRRIKVFSGKSLRYLSIIEEESKKCVEIASRLMSSCEESHARHGAMVNEVVLNVAALLRPQCSIRGIELAVAPPQESVVVDAPSDDLHLVLVNLVLNALEATDGTGDVSIAAYKMSRDALVAGASSPSEKEFVNDSLDSSLVAIEVSDTGHGIAPEHLDKVFEPFFTTKTKEAGRGLGLSICKEKVGRSGGHIGVVRTGPEGTSVRILLPVSSGA